MVHYPLKPLMMIMRRLISMRLIENDQFPYEFLSQLAEKESWRKEIHRPIYHVHKWWAKRLGSVFRGILLGCMLTDESDFKSEFYQKHSFNDTTVLDPFMGSGTTIGEAHKLGFTTLGRDINPVAVKAVQVALGPIQKDKLEKAFQDLSMNVGEKIRLLYHSKDSQGSFCDVLYYFWVMQTNCPACCKNIDLFSSYVIAANAYPKRKPEVKILCPACGDIFSGQYGDNLAICSSCAHQFNQRSGPAKKINADCPHCQHKFSIFKAIGGKRPIFRLYGKLVLTADGTKKYLPVDEKDKQLYSEHSKLLLEEIQHGHIQLPTLRLEDGHNTRQAISYGFKEWRNFFNNRQLLALGWLHEAIENIPDDESRNWLEMLFSGVLEFNNMFASYKGEGTGAVRHMFSHHILKPERTPIEANVWGTIKSSGSFSTLFRSRLLRATEYKLKPTEVNIDGDKGIVCSPEFSNYVEPWPEEDSFSPRAIYLSCGDSARTELPDKCIDFVVTDPPFFDNVHYSELADFFYSWQQITQGNIGQTTRNQAEVQDVEAESFAAKLGKVFQECNRVLKDEGLLIFTYHHSRNEGWNAVANAILRAGFVVINSHPVKAEMSVATPKSQAKDPIQLDIILVCRKVSNSLKPIPIEKALNSAKSKLQRLQSAGFQLSCKDCKIVTNGQLLTTLASISDVKFFSILLDQEDILKDRPWVESQ